MESNEKLDFEQQSDSLAIELVSKIEHLIEGKDSISTVKGLSEVISRILSLSPDKKTLLAYIGSVVGHVSLHSMEYFDHIQNDNQEKESHDEVDLIEQETTGDNNV
jgi:hypothetical protein